MFNPANEKPTGPTSLFNLAKHYKIWFSTNPDSFLSMEDQLRFIRMRQQNPNAEISFIYSSKCLTPTAIQRLNKFCITYRISPIEFEKIERFLEKAEDKALYNTAKEEIQRCVNNTGGNMASASDCVRLIVPVIEAFGAYADFDVTIKLSSFDNTLVTLGIPVLLPFEMIQNTQDLLILSPNSDFLAFGFNPDDRKHLANETLLTVRNLQTAILRKYQAPFTVETIFGDYKLDDLSSSRELKTVFRAFHQQYPNGATIFDFRNFLKTLPDSLETGGKDISVKNYLTRLSVVNISGPGVYTYLFSHLFPKGCTRAPLKIPYKDKTWLPYLTLFERSGIGFYPNLDDKILSENSVRRGLERGKNKTGSDLSWTKEGMIAKNERGNKLTESASILQGFWRNYRANKPARMHFVVLNRVSKVCNDDSILAPIREKKYALALRRACDKIRPDVVKLLLHYHRNGLLFGLNESSATKPYTALDWILKATANDSVKKQAQSEIIKWLRDAGAKTAEEVSLVSKGPSV